MNRDIILRRGWSENPETQRVHDGHLTVDAMVLDGRMPDLFDRLSVVAGRLVVTFPRPEAVW